MMERASDDNLTVGRLSTLWSLVEMIVRLSAGELFAAIAGMSNAGHSVPQGPGLNTALVLPIGNWEELKSKVIVLCEELRSHDLTTSLATAEILKKIINEEVVAVPVSGQENVPDGTYAMFQPMVLGRWKHFTGDLINRFRDEISGRLVFTL